MDDRPDQRQGDRHVEVEATLGLIFVCRPARHQEAGRAVSCLWPDADFKDFNDQLRGIRMGVAA